MWGFQILCWALDKSGCCDHRDHTAARTFPGLFWNFPGIPGAVWTQCPPLATFWQQPEHHVTTLIIITLQVDTFSWGRCLCLEYFVYLLFAIASSCLHDDQHYFFSKSLPYSRNSIHSWQVSFCVFRYSCLSGWMRFEIAIVRATPLSFPIKKKKRCYNVHVDTTKTV